MDMTMHIGACQEYLQLVMTWMMHRKPNGPHSCTPWEAFAADYASEAKALEGWHEHMRELKRAAMRPKPKQHPLVA